MTDIIEYDQMLQTKSGQIVDHHGKTITLRGINLGGWLMMEGYILGGRNIPESVFKAGLAKLYGPDFVKEFTKNFRENFFRASDCVIIKNLGFNCVRLPFNYRLLEEPGGLDYLKKTVKMFAKHGLYVILDMHAVPGSQNPDWHSDSTGQALFWEKKAHQMKFMAIWDKLVKTFIHEKWIAGYDIMNEPVTKDLGLLQTIYQRTIDLIREAGDNHIIFLEGNNWGSEIDFIKNIKGANLAISVHFYRPVEFTFKWQPGSVYPGQIAGKKWTKLELAKELKKYADFAKSISRPLYLGEFGMASRSDYCGQEFKWLEDVLWLFEEFGFHWSLWTYKAVKGMSLPDGLFQLSDSSGIIGNAGTQTGMDNFYMILKTRREDFFRLWQTSNFKMNKFVHNILKPYLHQKLPVAPDFVIIKHHVLRPDVSHGHTRSAAGRLRPVQGQKHV